MPVDPNFLAAFVVGLLSTVHCFGMCSGIVGALTLSLPNAIRDRPNSLLLYVLVYNLGRILSYTLVGALAGLISGGVVGAFLGPYYESGLFHWIAGCVVVCLGFYIGGWFPKFARLERVGRPVWRRLEPIGRRMLPVKSLFQAFAFGSVWGWLPCGLVYSVLIWALAAADAMESAGIMLAFGLGTLPAVVLAGVFVNRLVVWSRKPVVRRSAAVMVIVIGLVDLAFGGFSLHPHGHQTMVSDGEVGRAQQG